MPIKRSTMLLEVVVWTVWLPEVACLSLACAITGALASRPRQRAKRAGLRLIRLCVFMFFIPLVLSFLDGWRPVLFFVFCFRQVLLAFTCYSRKIWRTLQA